MGIFENKIEIKLKLKQETIERDVSYEDSENDIVHRVIVHRDEKIDGLLKRGGEITETADLTHYYKISRDYYRNRKILPYILKDNDSIKWNVPYKNVTVEEFINTHDIQDNDIIAIVGIPQSTGLEIYIDPELMWNILLKWDRILMLYGTYKMLKDFKRFTSYIKIKLQARRKVRFTKVQPDAFFAHLTSKSEWDVNEYSKITNMDKNTGEKILLFAGYVFNKKTCKYVKTYAVDKMYESVDELYYDDKIINEFDENR